MNKLPLWKLIARGLCQKTQPDCKQCAMLKLCISRAKSAAHLIQVHYWLTPKHTNSLVETCETNQLEDANIVSEGSKDSH